ncbi:hypothetical protein GE253_06150 [Niveispirillum sp. SYP-B3756]|uniref:hypothetical protein n=1 Tax=Niveispirillum sp. SYP-B3756 TaxID=2662178 RepID=UPI001290F0E6|nr:hypothetical protein [Niveispirillum sp. SYP-B3756]MQP64926.1 hypothetical protein [Niveispirillum sp. SYP-B3756]
MHHRQILDLALRELPAARAAYVRKVADALNGDPALEEREHLMFPVLAAAAAGIEPILAPADCARQVVVFMQRHAEGVAHTLYSATYLQDQKTAMAPWAVRLQADIAIAIMDQLSSGNLTLNEPKVWRFRADGATGTTMTGGPFFPYEDGEEEM